MSDNTTNPAPAANTLTSQTIKRNDTDLSFVPVAIARGDNKGSEYLGVDPKMEATSENLSAIVGWLSAKTSMKVLARFINTRASGLYDEACEEVLDANGKPQKDEKGDIVLGPVNVAELVNLLAEFSARGESKSDLEKELQSQVNELTTLDPAKDMPRILELMKDIAGTNSAIQLKKRERKPKAATADKPAEAAAAQA